MWKRILFVCFILFCIELGLLLMVLPWSELWERNFFLVMIPGARAWLLSSYVRGAVTGLGVLNLWVGLSDAWNFRRNIESLEKRPAPGAALDRETAETAGLRPPQGRG